MNKGFNLGIILGFLLVGCAGFTFPYAYYGMNLMDSCYDHGDLLGKTAADDQPVSLCKPDEKVKGKCVVMLADPFYNMKGDYLDCKQKLSDCEKKLK